MNLQTINSILILIIGIINILPVLAFFDINKTESLYGISINGESLEVLMRHRGVLLALLGCGLIYSVFNPEFRLPLIIAALISKFVFVFLTFTTASVSPEVGKVALIDVGSIAILLVVLGLHFYGK